jgi:hypothetical protein
MQSLDMVIADSLVAADFAPDLLRGMALPGLDMLAAQGLAHEVTAPHAPLLPAHLGWAMRKAPHVDVAYGWSQSAGLNDKAAAHERYLLQPVHLDVGSHGLILADPAALELSHDEALALIGALRSLVPDVLVHLIDSTHWLLDVPKPYALHGAVPEAALGTDILHWLPEGDAKRRWSALANEVQMLWHDHPVNDARNARGAQPINALWLAGDSRQVVATPVPYRTMTGAPAWLAAWPHDPGATAQLRIVALLSNAARDEDWSAYRNLLTGIDQTIQDALKELKNGNLTELVVAFTGQGWVRECTLRRSDLYKFWRRGKAVEVIDCPQ